MREEAELIFQLAHSSLSVENILYRERTNSDHLSVLNIFHNEQV